MHPRHGLNNQEVLFYFVFFMTQNKSETELLLRYGET